MMLKKTAAMICVLLLSVFSACARTETASQEATSDTISRQQPAQSTPDQLPAPRNGGATDSGDAIEIEPAEVEPAKEIPKPNSRDRLLEQADFIFDSVTLDEFAAAVSERFEMVVWIDNNALEEIGLDRMVPVTVNREGVSLQAGLSGALRDLGLAYDYDTRESYLLISTPEYLEVNLSTRIYRITGSVQQKVLIKNIYSAIAPDSWEYIGGAGTVASTVFGGLVITQTDQVHRQIAQTFGELLQAVDPGVAVAPKADWTDLFAVLSAKTNLEVENVPISDVLRQLSDEHKITTSLDQGSLDDVGLDDSFIIVTAKLKGLSWGTTLKLILEQYGLTYTVDSAGEVLTVTTPEAAEGDMVPVLYKIDELLTNEDDLDVLVKTITTTINPDYWADVGGAGTITTLPAQGAITVLQTIRTHRKLAQLIADLRQLKQ